MNSTADDPIAKTRIGALCQGLEHLGWVEGRNLNIAYGWTKGPKMLGLAVAPTLLARADMLIE